MFLMSETVFRTQLAGGAAASELSWQVGLQPQNSAGRRGCSLRTQLAGGAAASELSWQAGLQPQNTAGRWGCRYHCSNQLSLRTQLAGGAAGVIALTNSEHARTN